jgi:hypothetical protein
MRRIEAALGRRCDFANIRGGFLGLDLRLEYRHVTRHPFLKQELGRSDDRLGMKACAHHPIVKRIGDRDHSHSLMVGHVGTHDGNISSLGKPCLCVIQSVVPAVETSTTNLRKMHEVARCCCGVDHH